MAKFEGKELQVKSYDPEAYPFNRALAVAAFEQYMPMDFVTGEGTDLMLETMHVRYPYDQRNNTEHVSTRETDQQGLYYRNLYALAYNPLRPFFIQTYLDFIENVVQPQFDEPIVYQKKPTIRVHMPGDVAVGEYHKDTKYGHTPEAVNFWVPATIAYYTNTLHVQTSEDLAPQPVEPLKVGQYVIFDGVSLNHGNEPNLTSTTRVSFDFRTIPESKFVASDQTSINTGLRFAVGEDGYYDLYSEAGMNARREEIAEGARRTTEWIASLDDDRQDKKNRHRSIRQKIAQLAGLSTANSN